jgi:ABC-2 type transport system permease protein
VTRGPGSGFTPAVTYLFLRTAVNRGRSLLVRMRDPRFTVGALAFLAYLVFVASSAAQLGVQRSILVGEWLLVSFLLLPISTAWVFGGDDELISFSEAEVQYLFPAPATRRTLLVYKVVRGVVQSVPFVVFTTLVMGGRFAPHWPYFAAGVWVAFVTVDLHVSGASRVRAWLAERGLAGTRRRVITGVVLAATVGGVLWATMSRLPAPQGEPQVTLSWLGGLASTAPLSWVLAPFRAPARLAMSVDAGEFLARLPASLLLLALHVRWVLGASHFEDGTVRAAAHRTALRDGRSRLGMLRLTGLQLPLPTEGPAWVALLWKGLIGTIRIAPIRLAVLLGSASAGVAIGAASAFEGAGGLASLVAVFAAVYLGALGPTLLRTDLRQDLSMLDVLRSLPMRGREVVVGELAGPWLVLALGQWACLGAAVLLAAGATELGPAERVAAGLVLAIELPVVSLVGLVVQNAGVLWFPELESTGGFDVAGRRLLTLITTLLVLVGAGVPTALLAMPAVLAQSWLGVWVWPVVATVGVVPVLLGAWFVVGRMGARLEHLDPTQLR